MPPTESDTVAIGVALMIILAIIDALSFSGFNDEYFGPLYSIVFYALAVLFTREAFAFGLRAG